MDYHRRMYNKILYNKILYNTIFYNKITITGNKNLHCMPDLIILIIQI